MATGIEGTNNNQQTPQVADSASAKSRTQLSGDFDTFLMLLTTQLKHQDPLEPMDSSEFTSQLVQFATVEQAIATNENLEKMLEYQQGQQINNAVSYIGRFVQAEGNSSLLRDGVATFTYELPEEAETVTVTITDEQGGVVFSGPAPKEKGKNDVLWDGTNSFNGTDMPDGTYHIAVKAKDADGQDIEATTHTTGFVTAARLEDGKVVLEIGDIELPLDKVQAVRDPMDFMPGDDDEDAA